MGLCTALMFGSKVALASLPNIEPVSLLIILYTRFFGAKALGIIYTYVLLEGIFYGFGSWWLCYLYIWAVLFGVVMALRWMDSVIGWALISGLFGLLYGALCSFTYLFLLGPGGAWAYFLSGLGFDLAHCAGNVVMVLLLYRPLTKAMARIPRAAEKIPHPSD